MASRVAAALAGLATLCVLAAPAQARDATVTSFDGTPIATHFFPAAGLAPGARAPTVLVGHGWGGTGATDPDGGSDNVTGNTGLGPLRRAGFNVLTWDARGFGESGGQASVDSPELEGRDVQALIDWLAGQPEARLDGPGDPRVGMSGVSYGGAIQLVTAAIDGRVDAIAPTIAWNSLLRSLYRDGAVKQGWGTLLMAAGSSSATGGLLTPGPTGNGNLHPQIVQAFAEGLSTGAFSPASVAFFDARGIYNLIDRVRVPTLIVQGTVDTLFTLDEAIDNHAALARNGVPLKMIWFCGGHGICTLPAGPAGFVERNVVDWLRRHLAGERVATGPAFEWIADDGARRSSARFPLAVRPPLTGGGAGTLPISPGSPATGVGALIAATPAVGAVEVAIEPARAVQELLGPPRVRIAYNGTAVPAQTWIYAQVLDARDNRVLGNQVTPIPVTLDGQPRTVERTLEPIAVHATPSSRYRIQISGGTTVYGLQRSSGVANLTSIAAALPVRVAVDAAGAPVSSNARLVVGRPRGLARARRGRPVRVVVRARGANVRRVQVALRRRGKLVGRSRRFALPAGRRKVVRVRVRRALRPGRYRARAVGRVADGPLLRDAGRAVRLRPAARQPRRHADLSTP
jgi:ABC-2 type transport system ATP-binding protein